MKEALTQREYLRHELMDRAYTVSKIVDDMLCSHPSLEEDDVTWPSHERDLFKALIEHIEMCTADLYQKIADAHL